MKKIGLFGGTFDPVHNGHLAVGRAAVEQLALDTLYFIPAASPPHKIGQQIAPFQQRVDMLHLALDQSASFAISEIEGQRSGPSYTIDTLAQFRKLLGQEAAFFFIIGLDAFAEIVTWKRYDELLTRASFVVIDRPSHISPALSQVVAHSFPDYRQEQSGVWCKAGGCAIYSLNMEPVPVSSSMIRDRLQKGQSISAIVPGKVENYIANHRLFGFV